MMPFFGKLQLGYKHGDSAVRLIYLNALVFLVLKIATIACQLFTIDGAFLAHYLAIPASPALLLERWWTPVSYMFVHEEFFHFFFNMLSLYWFGKIFLLHFSGKQLSSLYLIGGLFGAVLYVAAFNIFPYYQPVVQKSLLLGASASVMAVIVATAVKAPSMQLQMLFIGNVRLKYIAIFFVLVSFLGITSDNGGGQLAHLGGALAGYLFVVSLQQGMDLTRWLSRFLDFSHTLFGRKHLKVSKKKTRSSSSTMSDGDYNAQRVQKMANIDKILDKIKTSGYESLNAEEKRQLFDQSNKR